MVFRIRPCLLCHRRGRSRGLCYGHYQRALRLVQTGKANWLELAQEGKALLADYELGLSKSDRFGPIIKGTRQQD
jgi:hypothetical protein